MNTPVNLNEKIKNILSSLLGEKKVQLGQKKVEIECSESFIIASIISNFFINNLPTNAKRIWIIAESEGFLSSLMADIEHYFKKSKLIESKNKNSIKNLFDTKSDFYCTLRKDLDADFPYLNSKSIESFHLNVKSELDTSALFDFLVKNGYYQTPCVQNESEFSIRGEVVDIFPNMSKRPYRIYLDFSQIEGISSFDVSSQLVRSNDEKTNELTLYGTIEEEKESCKLRDYITDEDVIITVQSENITGDEIFSKSILSFYSIPDMHKGAFSLPVKANIGFSGEFDKFAEKLNALLKDKIDVFIICDTQIQENRIKSLLFAEDKELEKNLDKSLFFETSYISSGFIIDKCVSVFTHNEIFSRKRNRRNNDLARLQTIAIDSFFALREGDLVVHVDYGVGKFISIKRIKMQDAERDYIKIEFAGEEFYYVPLERANLVQKYIGKEKVALDNLHSSSWKRKRERAQKNARIFAQKLLHLYAMRHQQNAFCHNSDTPWMLKFESEFEYEETQDQLQAIEDVKNDMEQPKIMDRIICGDVGFGKTEVAFRAAFKAIMSGKQVCFLSPTTILTTQHFNNFCARAASFPINIVQFSRIISSKEARIAKEKIENGDADIVFCTHKILRSEIKFKNLGLLIIDEEQRFGVNDKEKIKSLKLNVDTLTLTATPIPRTLYMSMIHLRDISLLKTPPNMRLAVKIFVENYDWDRVKDAIKKELDRGGQVYYLHNKTDDIETIASFLKENFKEARVEAISGKMKAEQIEDRVYDFATGLTDILVCTTIIENGIDVPNANTLIVDDATIYGTSQLYQIKGRVGRSHRQGYAYLLIPKNKIATQSAIDRIKVIAQNSTLGSGFNIAMNDLMLRGSGNILGKEQAGHVEEIGLDMYMNLLDRSIRDLEIEKENKMLENNDNADEDWEPSINILYTAYIPDEYIKETELKFNIYKKIANATSDDELSELISNVQNRFGTPPAVVSNLYLMSKLKIAMKRAGITEVLEKGDIIILKVQRVIKVNIDKLMALIRESKNKVRLDPQKPNFIIADARGIENDKRLNFICKIVEKL